MNAAATAEQAAAPWIERLARLGYGSKAVVYAIVGGLAAASAFGEGQVGDTGDAFAFIKNQPLGAAILGVVGIGLIGYTLWQFTAAVRDTDDRGRDAKGIALRLASAFRALVYSGLALEAIRLAFSLGAKDDGDATTHWTRQALQAPFGRWLVFAAGAGVVVYGLYQLVRAWKSKLGRRLYVDDLTGAQRRGVLGVARFGIAARGIVFAIIGTSIARAALQHSASEASGTSGALRSAAGASTWLLAIIGVGLIAYAVYELLNARYRRIRAA